MKVAITGAGGLLGRFLVDAFVAKGYEVTAIMRDGGAPAPVFHPAVRKYLCDIAFPESLLPAFEGNELVVHAAAVVSLDTRDRNQLQMVNAEGTRHVVDACLMCGVRRLIHISSVAAIGTGVGSEVLDEDTAWDGGVSAYAKSKYQAECQAFRGAAEGLEVQVVNPSVILAPVEKGRTSMRLIDYVRSGGKFYTDGLVNLVDVRDVADAVVSLSQIPAENPERFIVSGFILSYKEFFSAVAGILAVRSPKWKASRSLVGIVATLFSWTGLIGLSRDSLNAAFGMHRYDGSRICRRLGMQYRNPDDTIRWVCRQVSALS